MSLLLTGDLRGLSYLKKSITELPENTFSFCCTIDGSVKQEADLSNNIRPIKPNKDIDGEERLRRLREEQEDEKIR